MPQPKIKLVYFSGSRADYSPMSFLLKSLNQHPKVNLKIIHFSIPDKTSINPIITVYQETLKKFPDILRKEKPRYLVLQGDRAECAAAAQVAFILRIPIIHFGGGCITGSLDNGFRNIISSIAAWHFPATKEDAQRIANMKNSKSHILPIGEPGLDVITHLNTPNKHHLFYKFGFNPEQTLFTVVMHPDTADKKVPPESQIKPLLQALSKSPVQILQICPNWDTGGYEMQKTINSWSKDPQKWKLIENLNYADYLGFLKHANIILGNSSSLLIESPSFGTPVINISNRELGRPLAKNIISVGYSSTEILKAIKKVQGLKFRKLAKTATNPYGNGKATEKFLKYLDKYLIK